MASTRLIANRYEIRAGDDAVIGSGGMGTVYRGVDSRSGQTVAIKQMRPELVDKDPEILMRFRREGEVLRLLNHPNIVAVLDAVEQDGTYYLIMEYVPGGSLRELLVRNGRLPPQQAIQIALELADALSRAHHKHVIHRDIKPANVMLADDNTPRLTDFGVAYMSDSTRMTRDGSFVGTISYLAPEGFAGEIDARSDIWSFGVLLYEMLTGRNPFEEDTVAETINAIIMEPPDLSQLPSDVPPLLTNLIAQMLLKSPRERTGSMRLIAAQLEAIVTGAESLPENTPTPTPSAKMPTEALKMAAEHAKSISESSRISVPVRDDELTITGTPLSGTPSVGKSRRWLWAGVVMGILVVTVVGLFLVLRSVVAPTTALDCNVPAGEYLVLVADLEAIETQRADPSRLLIDDLKQHFEIEAPFAHLYICAYPQIIHSHEEAQALAQQYHALSVIWGTYNDEFVDVDLEVGYPEGFRHIQSDHSVIEAIGGSRARIRDVHTESLGTQLLGVLVAFQNADGDGYGVARTISILELINVRTPEIVGESSGAYGQRYFSSFIHDPKDALKFVSRSLELNTNHLQYMSRSGLLLRMGDIDGARRDALTAQRMGPEGWALPSYVLGSIALAEGDFDEAITHFSDIMLMRPDDWFIVNFRGGVHYLQGDYEDAREDIQQAIALGPDANFPYMMLLMLSIREGDLVTAQQAIQTVLREYPDPTFGMRIVDATFGNEFPIIFAPVFSAFGNLTLGQYEGVLDNIDQALSIQPDLTDLYMMRGFAECNLGNYQAAEDAYSQALELEPELMALYVFRAEVRLESGNLLGAGADVMRVMGSDASSTWAPIITAAQDGSLSCRNLLEYDLASLLSKTPEVK
jgi:serine/threonine protein kinase/tetratricopeptide (TPR) repeat protein